MPESDTVLLVRTARPVARAELQSIIPERVVAASEDTVLNFVVSPMAVDEESATILDRLGGVAACRECNGQVGSKLPVQAG